MEPLNREVLAAIAGDVLAPDVVNDIIITAKEMFDDAKRSDPRMTSGVNLKPSSEKCRG